MVFDVSKEQSFENCAIWAEEIRTRSGRQHVRGTCSQQCHYATATTARLTLLCDGYVRTGALVANKTDLEDRVFANARMRGQQFAQGYGLQYFETSAVRPKSRALSGRGSASRGQPSKPTPFRCLADKQVASTHADEH